MAHDAPAGPVETGAAMDYVEHENTYRLFLTMTKYGTLATAALMAAMAFSFFTAAGWFSGVVLYVILVAVGAALLR